MHDLCICSCTCCYNAGPACRYKRMRQTGGWRTVVVGGVRNVVGQIRKRPLPSISGLAAEAQEGQHGQAPVPHLQSCTFTTSSVSYFCLRHRGGVWSRHMVTLVSLVHVWT